MEETKYPRIILGLDISTACIGASVVVDNGIGTKPVIKILTHKSPKIPNKIKGIEGLFLRKEIFESEFIMPLTGMGITDVIIEEPLLSSNNAYTVATLLRFNGMIAESIYKCLGIVPHFISSYDARMYSFPQLSAIRKYNKHGVEYPLRHIQDAIKKNSLVLFGEYPFDIDKKTIMMDMVNEEFSDIAWVYNDKGKLKKENYDACDSLICVLAYININHHGLSKPEIVNSNVKKNDDGTVDITYETKMWDITFPKHLSLSKSKK